MHWQIKQHPAPVDQPLCVAILPFKSPGSHHCLLVLLKADPL